MIWGRISTGRGNDLHAVSPPLRRGKNGSRGLRLLRYARRAARGPGRPAPVGGAAPVGNEGQRHGVFLRLHPAVLLLPEPGDLPGGFGRAVTTGRLREIFEELIAQGAHNINLVTPTHFLPWILPALEPKLPVPVVYNCGGYESVETLRLLEGKVDVYLPDLKYADAALAARLSAAPDYFPAATAAIREMFRQTGPYVMEDGLLKRGVMIRHLVLPGQPDNTRRCIDWVAETFSPGQVLFSLMSQYTPQPGAEGPLGRHVTAAEYRSAAAYMENCGIIDGFIQERTAAREEYTPPFDLTGVL